MVKINSNLLFDNFLCKNKGLFEYGKCSKGRRCNYLHVFRNPSIRKSKHSHKKKKHHHD